jgi:hypothetical protein
MGASYWGGAPSGTTVPWAVAQSFSVPSFTANTSQLHTACDLPA